jgi:glycosyltransferase involved in cell wall biosynthesis
MKIAILTSGILPVPAVQGGAVENFLDFFLEYNDKHSLHDITVYSVWHPDVEKHPALKSKVNHYHFVNVTSPLAKTKKHVFGFLHKDLHHHYSIEYFLRESLRHIKNIEYDMIVLNNRPGYAETIIGQTKAKLVYNLYNDKLNNTTRNHQIIFDGASLIISTSAYITNRVKTIKDDPQKCVTVYSGIELDKFKQGAKTKTARESIGLSPSDFVMIFSGRVTQEKGILELIEAMIRLEDNPKIKLLVIGSSFYGNANNENEFARELMRKAEPLKDRIIFTGFIPYAEMPNYLNMADIAVIPSVWDDPFPTTVLEAQAMGLPIISTTRGGIPEEVTKENAILLQTDEQFVDNLAAAIIDLYKHPEKRQQMATASLERSMLFDKETYARNFFKALEQ